MSPQISRQAAPGDPADARADLLDAAHQRVGKKKRPEQIHAELTAGLRVRRDPAWVVIGGTGDESGAKSRDDVRPAPAAVSGGSMVAWCPCLPRRGYRSSD